MADSPTTPLKIRNLSSSPVRDDERECVAAVRSGSSAAFKSLYDAHASSMFAFAVGIVKSRQRAEDIIQDVFLAIWRNRATWDPACLVRTYLMRATYNRSVMHQRHLRVELAAHERIHRDAGSPTEWTHRTATDDALIVSELETALASAIDRLPPRAAHAYRLVREQHMSYAQAAEVMGISTHTVEIHMIRALKSLREQLREWRTA
jgi:RNA polymerase sigma-70 factor (ECF subfamily)